LGLHLQLPDSYTEASNQESLYPEDFFDLDPDIFYASHMNHCGFIPNAPYITSQGYLLSDQSSSTGYASTGSRSSFDFIIPFIQGGEITSAENEQEMAYLSKHFTEVIGPWLDLYDRSRYFGSLVPIKAIRSVLLRYALVAAAAKQLGRISGVRSSGSLYHQPTSEVCRVDEAADWFYKAANYYDKAISHMRTCLRSFSLDGVLTSEEASSHVSDQSNEADTDDLITAISIFSVYEFLDGFDAGWLQHLNGLQSLLVIETESQLSSRPARLFLNRSLQEVSDGRRAAFWNFAREDYIAACRHRTRTRLDTEDFPMWRASGLQITKNGSLYLESPHVASDRTADPAMFEDLVPHTLIWIVLRIMNYIAVSGDFSLSPARAVISTPTLGEPLTQSRDELWNELQQQLDTWYKTLPDYFQPYATIKHDASVLGSASEKQAPFAEPLYSSPMCAAAVQLYHFASIMLLLYKPALTNDGSRSASSIMKSYRELSKGAIYHSRKICGIALARPVGAVRVQMQEPLYVAGLCLETPGDREVVLELLRDIESDTGCPTKFRVHELMQEWKSGK
jgi:hypothetical protein